jgi:hypothetical protein
MQSEHKLALTKNYVLLVNESPVDDILDELRQQQIVNEEQREFIARQPTQKGRTRALLELLPRRGPKAFHAFCYALLARHKNELVSVLTGPEKEDMAVCFPEHSSFHLGGEVYLKAEKEEITLKQGAIEMCFPLIRWKMFETYLEDVDEAVEQIRNNRYSSMIKHLGGNVYLTVDNNDKTDCCVDIRYRWCSPIDHKMYPTPQGLSLTFEQFDKLKDVARVLLDLIPDLSTTLPCYMSHQNVEGAIYCGECNPNGPDFD